MRSADALLALLKLCLFGVLSIGQASGAARAEFVLGFDQSNYLVDAGAEFDVSIYLTETGTNILATDGLNSAGVVLAFNVPAMVSDPAQVTKITSNPGVNDVDDLVSTTIAQATATQAGFAELMFSTF